MDALQRPEHIGDEIAHALRRASGYAMPGADLFQTDVSGWSGQIQLEFKRRSHLVEEYDRTGARGGCDPADAPRLAAHQRPLEKPPLPPSA